jgi:CBS domain-containing protein
MLVRQIMTQPVIAAQQQTPVPEVARLLTEHRIGGVPVVDEQRRVVGIVSERDLFLAKRYLPFAAETVPVLFREWVDPARLGEAYRRSRHHTAADVMTADVFCCHADQLVGHAAWLMATKDVEQLPVLRHGRLVGMVTRRDILRQLAANKWPSS